MGGNNGSVLLEWAQTIFSLRDTCGRQLRSVGSAWRLRVFCLFSFLFFNEEEEESLLIYNAQGSPFRCEKLPVINGSPEHNNVQKLHYTYNHFRKQPQESTRADLIKFNKN